MKLAFGRLPLAFLLVALLLPTAEGQSASFFGKQVVRVEYSPAKQPISAIDLQNRQLVRPGSPMRQEDVGGTIDGLFSSGYYKDIQVDAELVGGGVIVRFITVPQTFVGHIDVRGKIKSPPDEGQLLTAVRLSPGNPFHPETLKSAEANITKLLRDNGLYESSVQIDHAMNPDTEEVSITVHIDSGKRARYEQPVIHGDPKLSESTIIRATGWRIRFINRWRQVTASLTQSGLTGIQKKYQDQDRLMADVNLQRVDYDADKRRLKPTLDLEAGPKVEIKALEAKVSKRRLRRYIPVYQEGTVDRDLLTEGARNLRDYFQSQGYPDVDVTFRQRPIDSEHQVIEYYIAKGQRKKLVHIAFEGNSYFQTETLTERMFLRESSIQFRRGRYSEGFRSKDEQAISNLYKANGFRNVKVTSTVINDYKGKANQIAVTFRIVEGPQSLVSDLRLQGVNRIELDTVRTRLSLGSGQPYSDVNVASDRNAILTLYSLRGFPKASFQYQAIPAKEPNRVILTYTIEEGPQEFVREVLLLGLHRTRRDVVEDRIAVQPGDPLSLATISEGQRRLYNLGIFSRVNAGIQNPDGDASRKYVFYDLEEARRYNVNIGFGAEIARFGATTTNLSSPAGSKGFSPRLSFDVSRLNFMGTDHTITLRTRLSNLQQRAALSFFDPNLFGHDGQTLTLSGLYDNSRDVQTFSSKRQEASVEVSRRLSKPSALSVQFAYRRVTTSDVVIPALLISTLLQPVRVGILSVNYIQDRRDNAADAHRGIYNTLNVGIASKYLGSQPNFLKALGRNATYTPIGSNLVFARQTTFGVIVPFNYGPGVGPTNAVPLPERFFGGGSITHRGFGENQAGPRDIGVESASGSNVQITGFPVGGNAVFFNNFELRFPLIGENISGVLFEDSGNIYQNLSDVSFRYHQKNVQDFNYMVHAAGFGVRYKTPLGPVRVDLAYALNPPTFLGFKGTYQELLTCNPQLPPDQLPSACQSVRQNTGHFQFFFSIGQTF
jgi:outer membrane protein assembly complex protein YaeT